MIDYYIALPAGLKASLIITIVISLVVVILGLKVKKMKPSDVPSGVTLMAVMFVDMVNEMQKGFFKVHWRTFTPYLLTILLFLGFANTASLFGLSAPLSNMSVALGFSFLAFSSIQLSALFVKKPKQRMKDLMEPHWAFLPINLIGEISTPFAMGIRLFGNLLSGAIIGLLLYGLLKWVGIIAGVILLHPIFDIFFGLVQAYVYFMLLTIFMSAAVETE